LNLKKIFLKSEIDDELIGAVEYIPKEGIDGRYYPYAVMDNYQQPFVCFF